jgi:hypothetical protein
MGIRDISVDSGKLTQEQRDAIERVRSIIEMPVVELDGNAYQGRYNLDEPLSIKNFVLKTLRFNDKGERATYTNLDTGRQITIGRGSAGKLAGGMGADDAHKRVIVHIPQIIKTMTLFGETSAEKPCSKFSRYSYYITNIKIDCDPYTILSTVGYNRTETYYDLNVLPGTPREVFRNAKGTTDPKYRRVNGILGDIEESDWGIIGVRPPGSPITSPITK